MTKRGRRPAGEDTRATIVDAARILFGAQGYYKTTLRGVAREAGVDPALIHHYFRGKSDLFAATFEVPAGIRPGEEIEAAFNDVPRDQLGESILRGFLNAWDPPEARETFVAMARSSLTRDDAAQATKEFLGREVLGRLIKQLNPHYLFPELRASLVISTLYGIGVSRWVTLYAPLAEAPVEIVVWYGAPSIQRFLDGPIAPAGLLEQLGDSATQFMSVEAAAESLSAP